MFVTIFDSFNFYHFGKKGEQNFSISICFKWRKIIFKWKVKMYLFFLKLEAKNLILKGITSLHIASWVPLFIYLLWSSYLEVVYSSAEDSAEDSLASEEFRKKTRRALRDTSGVAQYRDVFAGSVGKTSMKESRGDFLLQFFFTNFCKKKASRRRYIRKDVCFWTCAHVRLLIVTNVA